MALVFRCFPCFQRHSFLVTLLLLFLYVHAHVSVAQPSTSASSLLQNANKSSSTSHHSNHHNAALHNISSPEFLAVAHSHLRRIAQECLRTHFYETNNRWGHVFPDEFIFPEDAEAHFQELQHALKPFIANRVHSYAGYSGPWIENIWINEFNQKPLTFFRGLIPIFMPWIDSEIGREMPLMIRTLKPLLRKNVLYITVSQGDAGLHEAAEHFPNILTLSAGGFGHIALPLIKGELPWNNISMADIAPQFPDSNRQPLTNKEILSANSVTKEPDTSSSSLKTPYFEFDFAFYGTDRKERHNLLLRVKEESAKYNMTFHMGFGHDWQERMLHVKINVAPRGYGRSSFRFAETIHMGRIPLYLYDDILWLPYLNTSKSPEIFGFVAKYDQIPDTIAAIANMTLADYEAKLKRVQEIRHEYTYAGVMKQIEKFIIDPQGPHGGDLKCLQHPRTFFCCG